jgi:subtilisin
MDQPTSPTDPNARPSLSVHPGAEVQDVPAVEVDRPLEARPWDTSAVALENAIAAEDGHAIVAFKAPGSQRAMVTGLREAVPAAAIEAGLQLLNQHGVTVHEYYWFMGAAHVQLPIGVAAVLRMNPLVDYIEPRQWWTRQGVPATAGAVGMTLAANQITPWGMDLIRAPEAWSLASGAGASIQIIDTGHDRGHEDLPLVPLANCAGPFDGCDDGPFWHGSHVLGIFTARDNNVGIVGAAHGVSGSDVHVYAACNPSTGSCSTDAIISGIQASIWFDVLNMSLGGPSDFGAANAVAQAWAEGVVLVAAAGNRLSDQNPPSNFYPAGYSQVIGVSGVKPNKDFANNSPCVDLGNPSRSWASNYGSYVELAAPFWALSTVGNNGYEDESQGWCGTSMAAPHVAGAAALLRQQNPSWSNAQIRDQLAATAFHPSGGAPDVFHGYGIVDAAHALGLDPQQPPRDPPPTFSVEIEGPGHPDPDVIQPFAQCLYKALVQGGVEPYTYEWEVDGTPIGTGQAIWHTAGSSDFLIEVKVTDANNDVAFDMLQMKVDSMARECLATLG